MKEDEIHFYGDDHHFNPKWLLLIPAIALVAIIAVFCYRHFVQKDEPNQQNESTNELSELDKDTATADSVLLDVITKDCSGSNMLIIDDTVNDIPVRMLIPMAGSARLRLGYSVIKDTASTILCMAAADAGVSDKIIGAFVCQGELMGEGLSKKGFCAIINDSVTIGMSESSPLFENAINNKGYFFRQRALVDSGHIVRNEQRGKFLCRALCLSDHKLFVIICLERCSWHDFSQLLADIHVDYAISLQSAEYAKGWYHDTNGHALLLGDWSSRKYHKSANYIVWSLDE